jgi:GH15 family glucan-1,4-alpha-glucosidase
MIGGLLKRNRPSRKAARQGAFLDCSFWLVQALTLVGRKRDAENLFRKLLRLRNDVGLLSEEYDTRAGERTGNFPQAFVYCIGDAAFHLDPQPEPQRRG